MKRTTSILVLIALCSGMMSEIALAQQDSVTVGFILASTFNDRWNKDRDYFTQKFNELGGKVVVKDCYDQVENQIAAAKEFVEAGVDGIVIVAIDATSSAPAVKIADDAGIPVIAYDRIILNAPLDYYVSFNSVRVGEQMAQAVINKLPQGDILYIGGPSEDYNSRLIRSGVFNVLQPLEDKYTLNAIQASTWNQMDAYLVLQDYLTNDKEIPDAIICGADALVRGVVDVLAEYDALGKVIITGQDAELDICKMIVKGDVEMTLYKPIERLADISSKVMWKLIRKEEVESTDTFNNKLLDVPAYLLDPIVVNKSNMTETIIRDNYYSREEIYEE